MGGATPASDSLYPGRGYFLQTALGLTSCHDWVVSRVMPLMLCGPLMAWLRMSVTRQIVQIGGSVQT